jgi:hypothetical protein
MLPVAELVDHLLTLSNGSAEVGFVVLYFICVHSMLQCSTCQTVPQVHRLEAEMVWCSMVKCFATCEACCQ